MHKLILITGLVLMYSCTTTDNPAPVRESKSSPALPASNYHRVKKGDNIYLIALKYHLDFNELITENNLTPPHTLYLGNQIKLSEKAFFLKSKRKKYVLNTPIVIAKTKKTNLIRVKVEPAIEITKLTPPQAVEVEYLPIKTSKNKTLKSKDLWQWPVVGAIASHFEASNENKQGIKIAGKLGQPIVAAKAGKVVYSGGALVGYGKLIIIKHDQTYLSAYGHNQKLYVEEDDMLLAGQKIAEMGNFASDKAILHFEIRKNGKPINPINVLPK